VINVVYQEVATKEEADFVLIANATAPVLLGRMSPPGEAQEGQGEFNTTGVGFNEAGLKQGGYGYVTFIHEFGHGMGLAHPHDTGGGSTVMRGVTEDSDPGDFNLNQGVFTTMSYRSGNPDGISGKSDSDDYGYEGTLGALDIAVLQQKYGANTSFASGNDTYVIKDVNASGTFYATIWDTGGVDTMRYSGARSTIIDLRAATLQYEEGGGGRVSSALGIHGGFTIAAGVVIENAIGGSVLTRSPATQWPTC
jgi:serralysin